MTSTNHDGSTGSLFRPDALPTHVVIRRPDEPNTLVELETFVTDNADSEDLDDILAALRAGQVYQGGGGAAESFTVEGARPYVETVADEVLADGWRGSLAVVVDRLDYIAQDRRLGRPSPAYSVRMYLDAVRRVSMAEAEMARRGLAYVRGGA